MKQQEPAQILEQILEEVRSMDPVNIRTWFSDLTVLSFSGGHFDIGCPDQAKADYLNDHCVPVFTKAAQKITGYLVSLSFHPVRPSAAASAAPAVLPDGLRLHPDYTFDNFVVGPCNRLAHASCIAVSQNPGTVYNPLFLYGSVGLGKTHLLHAVCHTSRENHNGLSIRFLSCEQFVNGFISAIEQGQLAEFQNQHRSVDVLIIDDVQFLREREQSQEEFFHTFNALYNNRRQIILTADCPPAQLSSLEERLISRFKWGLVARLDPPSYETRIAIVKKKASLRGISLPEGIAELIAEHVQSNIREIEGALTVLYATAKTAGQPITPKLARQALGIQQAVAPRSVTMADIIEAVSREFDIRITDLQSKKRSQSITLPRQVCMYLGRQLTRHSLEEIGGHLGGRDHSTVLHACTKIEEIYKSDEQIRTRIDHLTRRLTQSQ
ncbi:MAG TPA: chromosomal replication initiator protein DnaA [Anaerohalosphaeraceae bacterium]|nr:chromosomal replication initiator protein DnaA [Anaerohalosphaeraceae bacterium]HQG05991.1 chromosomal replication initiator protein DnaA [Anaerohalosphaeraceae bacterium]HQI07273.1 chromosomal replication initiator protein DnaA [Anaerohalosphaeraceae bacterium]HQJ67282.1 chromosomal replication initiator protein DnaA [Anaerohalosphaeraceae bacterium]